MVQAEGPATPTTYLATLYNAGRDLGGFEHLKDIGYGGDLTLRTRDDWDGMLRPFYSGSGNNQEGSLAGTINARFNVGSYRDPRFDWFQDFRQTQASPSAVAGVANGVYDRGAGYNTTATRGGVNPKYWPLRFEGRPKATGHVRRQISFRGAL